IRSGVQIVNSFFDRELFALRTTRFRCYPWICFYRVHCMTAHRLPLATALSLALATVVAASPSIADDSLVRALDEIEARFRPASSAATGASGLSERIEQASTTLSAATSASGPESVSVLNRLVFQELQVKASGDLTDVDNLLPSRVLARKQGYCVGI